MFHETKVIDGILHYKTTPRGKWREYSPEQLTEIILRLQLEQMTSRSDTTKHRCLNCGSINTVEDEIASHPAYGC